MFFSPRIFRSSCFRLKCTRGGFCIRSNGWCKNDPLKTDNRNEISMAIRVFFSLLNSDECVNRFHKLYAQIKITAFIANVALNQNQWRKKIHVNAITVIIYTMNFLNELSTLSDSNLKTQLGIHSHFGCVFL